MRTWLWRGFWTGVVYAGLDVATLRLDFEPNHLRLALIVAVTAAALFVVWDGLADSGPPWSVAPVRPMNQPGNDQRLAGYVRMVESHLTAASPEPGLRNRLASLCDERLVRRHGLTRQDPGAEALLGSDLLSALDGPVRRFQPAEIDRFLERIESL